METGLNAFKEALHLKHVEAGEYSPLALAYIGDAVYELAIRTLVMNRGNMQVNKMHKKSASLVKAETQANIIKAIQDDLTEEELAVFRRGRNAQVHSIPSHASRAQYSTATALEALFGWLYLGGQRQRASDLFDVMMEE